METARPSLSIHIPVALLSLAIAALLASQIGASRQSTTLMQWQIETGQKSLEEMRTLEKQYVEAIANRETTVKQSAELQTQLQSLLTDLLELSKTDTEAQQIIKKWNVQQNQKAATDNAEATSGSQPSVQIDSDVANRNGSSLA